MQQGEICTCKKQNLSLCWEGKEPISYHTIFSKRVLSAEEPCLSRQLRDLEKIKKND